MYYKYTDLFPHMLQYSTNKYYVPDYQMWLDNQGDRIRSITDTQDGNVRISYDRVDDTVDTLDSEISITVYELNEITLG